jgi:hypothetical protein
MSNFSFAQELALRIAAEQARDRNAQGDPPPATADIRRPTVEGELGRLANVAWLAQLEAPPDSVNFWRAANTRHTLLKAQAKLRAAPALKARSAGDHDEISELEALTPASIAEIDAALAGLRERIAQGIE